MSAIDNLPNTFQLITSAYRKKGVIVKEKRLVFDPRHIHFYQVQRFQDDKKALRNIKDPSYHQGQILGFRVHNAAEHIFLMLLSVITFGYIKPKSTAVQLYNKKVFINVESYRKWRNINAEALSAMGVLLQLGSKRTILRQSRAEIQSINNFLQNEGPHRRNHASISSAKDPFEMASAALKWAAHITANNTQLFGLSEESRKKIHYRIAAFYILLSSRIQRDCDGEFLRISDSVVARDRRKKSDHNETKTVYELILDAEKPYKERKIYTADALSSINTRNDPISAKKVLNNLGKKGVEEWHNLLKELMMPAVNTRGMDKISASLVRHIMHISNALQEQYSAQDPGPILLMSLKDSYSDLVNSGLVTEVNKRRQEVKSAAALLAGYNLLKEVDILSAEEGKKVEINYRGQPTLFLDFPEMLAVEDKPRAFAKASANLNEVQKELLQDLISRLFNGINEKNITITQFLWDHPQISHEHAEHLYEIASKLKLPYIPPHINPLSGKFEDERHSACKTEALQFAIWHQRLLPSVQNTFNQLLKAKIESKIIEPKKKEELIANFAADKGLKIQDVAELYLYIEKLERLGRLIENRYLANNLERCLEDLRIDPWINPANPMEQEPPITINEPALDILNKVRRTDEEHLKMLNRYFPHTGLFTPLTPRKEEPRFDLQNNELRTLWPNEYHKTLFHVVDNNADDGDCCPGALAQAAFGKYAPTTGYSYKGDLSRDSHVIQLIRNAIAQYMIDHHEQFYQYVEIMRKKPKLKGLEAREDTPIARKAAVLLRAKEIRTEQINGNGDRLKTWFGMTEFKAISEILGRPVYILEEDKIQLTENGSLEMNKINEQYDAQPIYIRLKKPVHTELLLPRREGVKALR